MKCPVDDETLVIAERSGIEIDYCPKCRGVWLDRGELDKIVERSAEAASAGRYEREPQRHYQDRDDARHYKDRGHKDRGHPPRRKKKDSFLGELFDF